GFGDTAALMLTVASPRESEVAVSLRAAEIERRLRAARASSNSSGGRASLLVAFPFSLHRPDLGLRLQSSLGACLGKDGVFTDIHPVDGKGFVALDGATSASDNQLLAVFQDCVCQAFCTTSFDPGGSSPPVVRHPADHRDH